MDNVTVCELIKLLDKEINKRTASGTERILGICVNGKYKGYITSAKLDGWGSGLIADVTLELNTDIDELDEWELNECKLSLLQAFPESFINKKDELIAHKRSNTYLCLSDCKKPIDIECKVLEWFSRPAYKGMPYSQKWRNRQFRKFMLDGINDFLETGFTESDMEEIYQYLGNAINHEKTVQFVESGYDFKGLRGK